MKEIKIRFEQDGERFFVKRKSLFGWKYIGRSVDMGYGGFYEIYTASTKEELLNIVLENFYKVDKRFVRVIEYPTILIY
jgi:hypothetical protein